MHKVIKLRIYPNKDQIQIIEQTLGTLRFLYNQYLDYNAKLYQAYKDGLVDRGFISKFSFYKEIYSKLKKEYPWIPECSDKCSRQGVLIDAELAYKNFFKGLTSFPKFKSKKRNPVKSYIFHKIGVRFDKPRMIWIPILHYVEFKDKGYYRKGILNEKINITSGRVIKDNYGRYFVSLNIEDTDLYVHQYGIEGFGIDMGVKNYCTIYDGDRTWNINHPWKKSSNTNLNFYQNKIDSLKRVISMKVEINKKNGGNIYQSQNIIKLWDKVRKYYKKIHDYMDDFIKKVCNTLMKAKPEFITLENLDISEMLGNKSTTHKFHGIIGKSNWYKFKRVLIHMAESNGCEIRIADKYYPSSKKCHICGHKNDITLKDRTITCSKCGTTYDRDMNAAINLYNLKEYSMA
jgi:putative transposase